MGEVALLMAGLFLAAILAGITAYLSIRFLMRYFETKNLRPFGFYCIYVGILVLIIVQLRK